MPKARGLQAAGETPIVAEQMESPVAADAEGDAKSEAATEDRGIDRSKSFGGATTATNTTHTDSSSGGGGGEELHEKTIIEKCLSKIPFTMLVAMLMAIPIGFLIIYSILNFVTSSKLLNYVNAHEDFILSLGRCGIALVDERGGTCNVLLRNSTEEWEFLFRDRKTTDEICGTAANLAMKSPDKKIAGEWTTDMRNGFKLLAETRALSLKKIISTSEVRSRFTTILYLMDAARSLMCTNPSMASEVLTLVQLKLVWNTALGIAGCRAVGAEILPLALTVPMSLMEEYGGYRGTFLEFYNELKSMSPAGTPGATFVSIFEASTEAQSAITMMEALYANIWLDESWMTYRQWFDAFTAAFNAAPFLEADFVSTMKSNANKAVALEAVKLIFALIGCVFAAGLILKSNLMTQKKIDKVLTRSKTMQRAVQKFVPRSFLKLCGCTSILHVSAGDETQVATALLYSNIRNFGAVSETMGNEELFNWLQSYLHQMTGITETNKGFIDKFTGDAIFAVFTNSKDAIRCSIDMHTAVGELNLRFVSKRGKHLIQIGAGVHYAIVSAGFLGDESRLTVTMISAEVSIAQRLEWLSKRYGARILVSMQAMSQVGDISQFDCRNLGETVANSTSKPLGIYEVFQSDDLNVKNYKTDCKELFEEAVGLRLKGKIDKSNILFERCRTMASAIDVIDDAVGLKLSHNEPRDIIDDTKH